MLDRLLSACSFLLVVAVAFTIGTALQEDRSSPVRSDQQWMQWYMFLLLAWAYLLPPPTTDQATSQNPSFYVQLAARAFLLVMGCMAFHLGLGGRRQASHLHSKASLDFYALQRWGSLSMLEDYSGDKKLGGTAAWPFPPARDSDGGAAWWFWRLLVETLQAALQLWMALHAARWFQTIVGMVTARLVHLELDLKERHAADLDDIHFSLAVAYIFAASYVATPSLMSGEWHSFALLGMLGVQNTALLSLWLLHSAIALLRGLTMHK